MSEHAIEVVAQDMELHLRLVCHAVPGSPCRKRPPEGDERESWYGDEPDLVDGECWATEWVSEAGWDDAIIAADSRGRTVVWGSVPVSVRYDEGVAVSLVENPPALVPEPSDSAAVDGSHHAGCYLLTVHGQRHGLCDCRCHESSVRSSLRLSGPVTTRGSRWQTRTRHGLTSGALTPAPLSLPLWTRSRKETVMATDLATAMQRLLPRLAEAEATIQKVRELHRHVLVGLREDGCGYDEAVLECEHCGTGYPCRTIRAIEGSES